MFKISLHPSDKYYYYNNIISFSYSVISPYTFEICNTSSEEFGPYEHGGIAVQVKVPKKGHHVSMI